MRYTYIPYHTNLVKSLMFCDEKYQIIGYKRWGRPIPIESLNFDDVYRGRFFLAIITFLNNREKVYRTRRKCLGQRSKSK
jgi:hypothetical protein